jgi:AraC-like DNA-binding protein
MTPTASLGDPIPRGSFEPAVLRAHRLFESRDLDDTRERISRVMQPHELVPLARKAGGVRSHMDFVRIGGMGLGTIDFGDAMRVDVDAVEDYHLLMFCLRGQADARANGRRIEANRHQGMICAPGQAFVADLSSDCEQFVVRLDRRTVEAHCGTAIQFDEFLDLRRPGMQAWMDQLRLLATSPALLAAAQASPLVAAELERLMLHLLLQGQAWVESRPAPMAVPPSLASPARGPASGCVRRAENFIEAHADEPLRLADIARAAGVPARTLVDAFRRFRDTSPMQHLRDVRLDRARDRLRRADPGTRVADVALDCGFAHLGRFSQVYQQRFGESPSSTLGRR